jgi:hypothetical protein
VSEAVEKEAVVGAAVVYEASRERFVIIVLSALLLPPFTPSLAASLPPFLIFSSILTCPGSRQTSLGK